MQRVAVIGSSGSGKSTTAREIARILHCAALELDSVYHQANWVPLGDDEFRERIEAFVLQEPRWVIDGNYHRVRDVILRKADTVVWLDLPRPTILRALLWRTLRRGILRETLWNGNREDLRNLFSLDPMRSVLVWSYTKHADYVAQFEAESHAPENQHISWIRLRSRRAVAEWLEDQRTPA